MQIGDLDSDESTQEIRIVNLRRSLGAAETRVKQLETEVDELTTARDTLEKTRSDAMFQFGQILEKAGVLRRLLKQANETLEKLEELSKEPR